MKTIELDALMLEWEGDSTWDKFEPHSESLRIAKLHSKYLNWRTTHLLLAKKADLDYVQLRADKILYHKNQMPTEEWRARGWEPPNRAMIKETMDATLARDKELLDLIMKKEKHSQIAEFCTSVLGELKSRHFDIRTYVDWEKFLAGN